MNACGKLPSIRPDTGSYSAEKINEGVRALDRAVEFTRVHSERCWEPELHRLRGKSRFTSFTLAMGVGHSIHSLAALSIEVGGCSSAGLPRSYTRALTISLNDDRVGEPSSSVVR